MNHTRIKICGITTAEDAKLAVSLGADYIGVIFAESPRRVDLARAREIRAAAPGTRIVGVFRDQAIDEVVHLAREAGVDLVQLHGEEPPEYCDEVLARGGKPVIKAFRADRIPGVDVLARYTTTSYFLFDLGKSSPDENGPDTTEHVWKEVSRTRRKGFRVFLAGALDPSNVREAIRRTHAFAVDVCRGVERAPGVKDPDVLQRFFSEART
jgi:phosphoribosylanthranilate isomerase